MDTTVDKALAKRIAEIDDNLSGIASNLTKKLTAHAKNLRVTDRNFTEIVNTVIKIKTSVEGVNVNVTGDLHHTHDLSPELEEMFSLIVNDGRPQAPAKSKAKPQPKKKATKKPVKKGKK